MDSIWWRNVFQRQEIAFQDKSAKINARTQERFAAHRLARQRRSVKVSGCFPSEAVYDFQFSDILSLEGRSHRQSDEWQQPQDSNAHKVISIYQLMRKTAPVQVIAALPAARRKRQPSPSRSGVHPQPRNTRQSIMKKLKLGAHVLQHHTAFRHTQSQHMFARMAQRK